MCQASLTQLFGVSGTSISIKEIARTAVTPAPRHSRAPHSRTGQQVWDASNLFRIPTLHRVRRQDLSVATNTLTKPQTSPRRSSIGLKFTMAVTGLFFAFFVLFHMYGNLKILAGHEPFNEYAVHLREMFMPILPYEGLLWILRVLLLVSVVVHVYAAVTLWQRGNAARGQAYSVKKTAAATLSSRTMRWGGLALLLFIVFHLVQFTFRWFHAGGATAASSPAEMVVAGFQTPWVTIVYVLAMIALGLHLHHGCYSAFQTLGFTNTAKARGIARGFGLFVAVLVVVGFLVPPLAIQFGLIQ